MLHQYRFNIPLRIQTSILSFITYNYMGNGQTFMNSLSIKLITILKCLKYKRITKLNGNFVYFNFCYQSYWGYIGSGVPVQMEQPTRREFVLVNILMHSNDWGGQSFAVDHYQGYGITHSTFLRILSPQTVT